MCYYIWQFWRSFNKTTIHSWGPWRLYWFKFDIFKNIFAVTIILVVKYTLDGFNLIKSIFYFKVQVVGNKTKGGILKQMFKENKARQIFRKTNISYPLIRTRTSAYQGVKNVCFSKNLACFILLEQQNALQLPVFSILFSTTFLEYRDFGAKNYFTDQWTVNAIQIFVAMKRNFSGLFFFRTSREVEFPREYLINAAACLSTYHWN